MSVADRLPEPALVRGALVSLTAIAATAIGRNIGVGWVDIATTIYAAVSAIVAAVTIRPAVVPYVKLPVPQHPASPDGPGAE